jgi:hypothetical protein
MIQRLRRGGITDVEGILETPAARLAEIVGSQADAQKLREMAKTLLDQLNRSLRPTKSAAKGAGRAPAARKRAAAKRGK